MIIVPFYAYYKYVLHLLPDPDRERARRIEGFDGRVALSRIEDGS